MNIVIDNYDSFTYNLVQYIGEIDSDILVYKNNKITIEEIININPDHIIISPGPGRPEDAGISIPIIDSLKDMWSKDEIKAIEELLKLIKANKNRDIYLKSLEDIVIAKEKLVNEYIMKVSTTY